MGGISADKSFPRAGTPAKRSFPIRLKVFVGGGGRYEEGMDFVGRMSKMMMFCAGGGSGSALENESAGGDDTVPIISQGTSDILRFLSFVTPYYNPSNTGSWTFALGAFLHYLSYELCARVGVMTGLNLMQRDHSDVATRLIEDEPYLNRIDLPGNEIVAFLDKLVPLCQQVSGAIINRLYCFYFALFSSSSIIFLI